MFHVKDGLYFKRRIGAEGPGYSWQESIDYFFKIQVVITQPDRAPVIDERIDRVVDHVREKVIFTTEIEVKELASVMASMSARGESAETFKEALEFLKRTA